VVGGCVCDSGGRMVGSITQVAAVGVAKKIQN
jgi:hypothetical protein